MRAGADRTCRGNRCQRRPASHTDLEGSVDLRALLGDDRARIAYDLERVTGWFHSTLWTEKNGGKARSVPVSALEDALHSGARVL